jgi:hypothetical protein
LYKGIKGNQACKPETSVQEVPATAAQQAVGSLGIGSIFLSLAIVSVPLALFSGVLLALVFRYRITQSTSPFSDLRLANGENDSLYYYVNFPAARLIFVASWSSSVAPTLVSFVMALSLFPTASKLFKNSKAQNGTRRLPTPYQVRCDLFVLHFKNCPEILIINSMLCSLASRAAN